MKEGLLLNIVGLSRSKSNVNSTKCNRNRSQLVSQALLRKSINVWLDARAPFQNVKLKATWRQIEPR